MLSLAKLNLVNSLVGDDVNVCAMLSLTLIVILFTKQVQIAQGQVLSPVELRGLYQSSLIHCHLFQINFKLCDFF